jgi:hypothetical protein
LQAIKVTRNPFSGILVMLLKPKLFKKQAYPLKTHKFSLRIRTNAVSVSRDLHRTGRPNAIIGQKPDPKPQHQSPHA